MGKEGVFERLIREALERYKRTGDLKQLCIDMIDIGDHIHYGWMYSHAIDKLDKLFEEIIGERNPVVIFGCS